MFGIGQAYKPYPTNMRQRVVATHIYKAFLLHSANRDFFPICCSFMQIGNFSFLQQFELCTFFNVTFELSMKYFVKVHHNFQNFLGFFDEERQVLTMIHLFGIGLTQCPILQTMCQRVVNEQLYISPIFTIFFTLEYRSFFPFFTSLTFRVNSENCPLFTVS